MPYNVQRVVDRQVDVCVQVPCPQQVVVTVPVQKVVTRPVPCPVTRVCDFVRFSFGCFLTAPSFSTLSLHA